MLTSKELVGKIIAKSLSEPGGFKFHAVASDGEPICRDCCIAQRDLIEQVDPQCPDDDQWRIISLEINLEDPDMVCAHCGEIIESEF